MARYALVIGIVQYDNFSNLPKAELDAEAIAQLLERHHYMVTRLPRKLVSDMQWVIDPTKRLTGDELSAELKLFFRERAASQEAIIYFAGHGFRLVNSLTDEELGYLATSDSEKTGRHAISINDLNILINGSNLGSLVMLLDCCYAGALIDQRNLLQPTQRVISQKHNNCLIAACRNFERAREGKNHGIFTDAVLNGLSIEHARVINGQGQITSKDLDAFVTRELKVSGQEVISAGMGRAIPLVSYQVALPPVDVQTLDSTHPYQGLRSFDKTTAQFFFGRERVTSILLEKLELSAFVPVIGASGSGKSSVVRAGLIPELEASGWTVLPTIQPGGDPISKLKSTFEQQFRDDGQLFTFNRISNQIENIGLRSILDQMPGSSKVLMVIDQFEEIFTICSDESKRGKFIELLTQITEVPSRLSIVITMRADFLEPCLNYQALTQLIQDGQVLISPLNHQELEDAIVKPAKKKNFQLAEGLLDLILKDVEKEKNCLPLLQFVLTELWDRRDLKTRVLPLSQYKQMGGVTGALDQHAETAYEQLSLPHQVVSPEQAWAKEICLRLVKTQVDVRDTRRRKLKRELLELAEDKSIQRQALEVALQQLIDRRLLVAEEELGQIWVDLTHEALMERWSRFAQWREDNKELRILRDRMEDAYKEWDVKQRNEQFLLMGGLLTLVREHWQNLISELSPNLREFYTQSDQYEQRQAVERQRAVTAQKEIEAELERQASDIPKLLANNPVSALILAIQIIRQGIERLEGNIPGGVELLLKSAVNLSKERYLIKAEQGSIRTIACSLNGNYIASGGSDSTIKLWSSQLQLINLLHGHTEEVNSVAFSPDGKLLVSGSNDYTLKLWDLQGVMIGNSLNEHKGEVNSVVFSPDGKLIASSSNDCTVRLWNHQGKAVRKPFHGHKDWVNSVAFSPDMGLIASASDDTTVRIMDLRGDLVAVCEGHQEPVKAVVFNPNGQTIASGSWDGTIRLWNLQGQLIGSPFYGHEGWVNSLSFSKDGGSLLSASGDGTIRLWNTSEQFIEEPLRGHLGWISGVDFSSDSKYIISGGHDDTIRVWDGAITKEEQQTASDQNVPLECLLKIACDRLSHHSRLTNPKTEGEKIACDTCQKYSQ